MDIKQRVAHGIIKSIAKLWQLGEQQDFIVRVENVQFKCHKFILGACSEYFRGLFRSDMKENREQSVEIVEITQDTFKLILTALYTGKDVITNDNVIDFWYASHRLLIDFLIEESEDFVLKTMSVTNFANIHKHASKLDSKKVLTKTGEMILKHFDVFRQKQPFLDLPPEELLQIVASQDLVASSEDVVVESILKWAEYSPGAKQSKKTVREKEEEPEEGAAPTKDSGSEDLHLPDAIENGPRKEANDRGVHLGKLMAAARLCLVSHDCLEMLLNSDTVLDNRKARALVREAVLYQLRIGRRHGLWPAAAIHRNNSELQNVAVVMYGGGKPNVLPLPEEGYQKGKEKWRAITDIEEANYQITVFDNKIYALAIETSTLFCLKDKKWEQVKQIPNEPQDLFPLNEFIYFFHPSNRKVTKLNPLRIDLDVQAVEDFPSPSQITSVSGCEQKLLVFTEEKTDAVVETGVHCFDTTTAKWKKLNNIRGPAQKLIMFEDKRNKYVLLTNGQLLEVLKAPDGYLDFQSVEKLWDFPWDLYGAVTYKNTLFILGGDISSEPEVKPETESGPQEKWRLYRLQRHFDRIHYIGSAQEHTSHFLPAIVEKN